MHCRRPNRARTSAVQNVGGPWRCLGAAGIPAVLKTQPFRPKWTGPNLQPSGSIPVSATNSSFTNERRVTTSDDARRGSRFPINTKPGRRQVLARIGPRSPYMGANGAPAPPSGRTAPGCRPRCVCGVVAVSLALWIPRLGSWHARTGAALRLRSIGSGVDYTLDALYAMLDRPPNGINTKTVERHLSISGR